MSSSPINLNDGTIIPPIGFGTGTGLYGSECADLVLSALNAGYRYLDSAQMYRNGSSIGEALKRWEGGSRKDVYIVTKFGQDGLKEEDWEPRKVLKEQMKLMGVDHVDLYLIHSPLFAKPNLQECWKTMEALQKEGLTKSIGVSNFREEDILEIKKVWTVPPTVNQIEYHPYVYHAPNMLRLRSLMDAHDIKIEAYGPLTALFRSTGGPVEKVIRGIAEKHGSTEAQVHLAWAKQYGDGVIVTTSRNEGRQKEQLASLDKVTLTADEVEQIAQAGKGRFFRFFMKHIWDEAKP
ncbi:NADP-dependent oxidoreductase domain-containing protein [Dioszegia hungarica]|uniref:NADP-dependent oxidoreductase domain-containing protein n=1 Tax=Dioszegia hungarica TaxID=4972 RepID=A0AA38LSY5_9TREE|nr:NADP-dependent oxidoreductase domain-containing protein [Dioszegia hungarica]KAI9634003.1 NADP-dependent oxidoreductase domain-containing protein [Dioszegia hungarica]